MRLPVSVLVMAKDEERSIAFCLRPLKGRVQEVLLGDTGSTDRTVAIARSLGARVLRLRLGRDFSAARNRMIVSARAPWILSLDADSRVAARDVARLKALTLRPGGAQAYGLPRRNYSDAYGLLEDWRPCRGEYPAEERFSGCGGYYPSTKVALFRNRPEIRYRFSPHESLLPALRAHELRLGDSRVVLHHFEFLKGDGHHGRKHRLYESIERDMVAAWPRSPELHYQLVGDLLRRRDDLAEAAALAARMTRLAPSRMRYWMLRARVEMERGDLSSARRCLETSLRLQRAADNLCLMGWLCLRSERPREAGRFLRLALARNRRHPLAWNLLGVLESRTGRMKEALRCFDRALDVHPRYADAAFNRSLLDRRSGG